MNIFEAIRYLQDKPEGTELVTGEIKLTSKGNENVWIESTDNILRSLTRTILICEHADFQPVVDWSKVAVDTKVLVRDEENASWEKKYFAKYIPWSKEPFRCFSYGSTEWSSDGGTTDWKYCKLAEV